MEEDGTEIDWIWQIGRESHFESAGSVHRESRVRSVNLELDHLVATGSVALEGVSCEVGQSTRAR